MKAFSKGPLFDALQYFFYNHMNLWTTRSRTSRYFCS